MGGLSAADAAKAALPRSRRERLQSGALLSFPSPHASWQGPEAS